MPPSEFTGLCIRVEVSYQVLVTLLCLFWVLQSTDHRGKSDLWGRGNRKSPISGPLAPDKYLMSGKLRWLPGPLCNELWVGRQGLFVSVLTGLNKAQGGLELSVAKDDLELLIIPVLGSQAQATTLVKILNILPVHCVFPGLTAVHGTQSVVGSA